MAGIPLFRVFQFHIGTIKSVSNEANRKNNKQFQFHIGTIKRLPWIEQFLVLGHFNSTLVRLKDYINGFGSVKDDVFQFHIGTIKSQND